MTEAADQGPEKEPDQSEHEDGAATVNVSETAKGKQESARDQREDIRWPGLRLGRNVERGC